jgi:hypothetical protein
MSRAPLLPALLTAVMLHLVVLAGTGHFWSARRRGGEPVAM